MWQNLTFEVLYRFVLYRLKKIQAQLMTRTQSLPRAFRHAFAGMFHFLKNDRNGKIHSTVGILVCMLGMVLHLSATEWSILLLCCALVISLEMGNHALERLCDTVHPAQHPGIKTAKDVAAAAVLWSVLLSVIIGLILFIPKIIALL